MATFTVTSLDDSDPGETQLTLREAVEAANATTEADLILFDSALSNQTISLLFGAIEISSDISISGTNGAQRIGISSNGLGQIFDITDGSVFLQYLELEQGNASQGGAIAISGTTDVRLNDVWLHDNSATEGAAIYVGEDAAVNLRSVRIYENRADIGGGVFADDGASLEITNSYIYDNRAIGTSLGDGGGGIALNNAILDLDGTDFLRNYAYADNAAGGAIMAVGGTQTIGFSEFDGNGAGLGGGAIYLDNAALTLAFSEFNANTATGPSARGSGGAIYATGVSTIDAPRSFGTIVGSVTHATNNIASDSGGFLYLDYQSRANFFSANVRLNQARDTLDNGGGGGIFSQGTLEGNYNFSLNTSQGHGGALMARGGVVDLGGNARANTAEGSGGGFYLEGGRSTISTGFSDNSAGGDGGGLAIVDAITANLTRLAATRNQADGSGGGVAFIDSYVQGNFLVPNNGLESNISRTTDADGGGGGIFVDGRAFIASGPVTMFDNRAETQGNGLLSVGAPVVLDASSSYPTGPVQEYILGGSPSSVLGGRGSDIIVGTDGNDIIGGGLGANTLVGGLGNDLYIVHSPTDAIQSEIAFSLGGGIDTVRAFVDFVQPENVELLRLGYLTDTSNLNGTGNDAPGTLVGNAGNNILAGRGGNDQINGNGGNDRLIGNTGRDTLVGGEGQDVFVFTAIADSRGGSAERDFINGFTNGEDRIDLSQIDANRFIAGDQPWTFIGTAAFDGNGQASAGQLRYFTFGDGNYNIVEADLNGDGTADLQIFVNLTNEMTGSDFIL